MSPDSTSAASQRSSSTVLYSHEPLETYQHRVVDLCLAVLDKGSPTVERLQGGGFNRIIGLRLPGCDYILRVPRYDDASMSHDVGPLELLRHHPGIPAPIPIMFDICQDNALGEPYMIQERISGKPLVYDYPILPHETKCAIARDLGRVVSTMHGIRNRAAGRLIWKENSLRLEHLDSAQKDTPLDDGRAGESTVELILHVLRSKLRIATELNQERDMSYLMECFENLSTVAIEMEQVGVWDTEYVYCLCHRDLEPRNILVSDQGVTGILDWDSALFGPLLLSCGPPMWLWAWCDDGTEDERQAGELPPTREAQELKRLFEDAAGPIYMRFAYQPQYRLARQLIRCMLDELHTTEDFRDFERFCEEWASLKDKLKDKL